MRTLACLKHVHLYISSAIVCLVLFSNALQAQEVKVQFLEKRVIFQTEGRYSFNVKLSRDGHFLACHYAPDRIKVWDTKTNKEVWRHQTYLNNVGMDLSPDGSTILVGGNKGEFPKAIGEIYGFDLRTDGKHLLTLEHLPIAPSPKFGKNSHQFTIQYASCRRIRFKFGTSENGNTSLPCHARSPICTGWHATLSPCGTSWPLLQEQQMIKSFSGYGTEKTYYLEERSTLDN